eukprot:TRINITY_DN920_c0_g1_i3.p1 TRINITY_DN920_c0_g1~~TRINITY_DN920_c0_g1_i3.p1  ORF type:complete len:1395 (-),score=386.10 TRINITY_DN920_c0_g1_i3:125-4309(-)
MPSPGAFSTLIRVSALCLALAILSTVQASHDGCEIIGEGGCRGPNWSSDDWPKPLGNNKDCCSACTKTEGCTGYHISKKGKECVLYGHKDLIPAKSLGGNCFRLKESKKPKEDKKKKEDKKDKKEVKPEKKKATKKEPPKETPKEEPKKKATIKQPAAPPPPKAKPEEKKPPKAAKPPPPPKETKKEEKPKKSSGNKKRADKKPIPEKVDNKYLVKVGEGGCRGQGWSEGDWPKWFVNRDTYECAKTCLKSKGQCTAIHVLEREMLDGGEPLSECLLFNHKKVTAVPRLGGNCYKLMDNPHEEEEIDESLTEVSFSKPVSIFLLGKGRCRGPMWQSENNNWPKASGHMSKEACSEECAKLKGCTSFDLTGETSDGGGDCLLYSHRNVIPANFQKGSCYGLQKRLSKESKPEKAQSETVNEQEDEEDDDDLELEEDASYFHQCRVRCRGPNWTKGSKWPKEKGRRTLQGCANACQLRKGCTAFDVSEGKDEGTWECTLYGHKEPAAASAVPGECYILESVTEDDEEDEDDDDEDDIFDLGDDVIQLGTGACRGENWQSPSGSWPKVMGLLSPEACKDICEETKGCTAFDLSPSGEKKEEELFNCYLFGHKDVVPASAVPGNCIAFPEAIPSENDDDDDQKEYKALGKGLCRGANWSDTIWPKIGSLVSNEKECFLQCKERATCTAFDVSPSAGKLNCFMYGHGEVQPASALSGDCYRMKGRSGRKSPSKTTVPTALKGACRGEGWQGSKGWPRDKRGSTLGPEDCSEFCEELKGCTAFDMREDRGEQVCTFYNHKAVQAAPAVPGHCYIFPSKDAQNAEEKITEGLKLLGLGACRGNGWTSGKKWPKEIKGRRLSLRDCAEESSRMKGATAFDLRQDEDEVAVCTIYGHKDVVPAIAVPGKCYAATKMTAPTKGSPPKKASEKKPAPKPKKKVYKIPEFEEPKVIKEEESDDDVEWLFEPPPPEVRSRAHIDEILDISKIKSYKSDKLIQGSLRSLKKIYESSVEPLETLFKYRELSNRHYGDPEIFAKPLVVLMGPWSGGKSTMINYLLGTEYTSNAFKATAEPSEGFNFNIAMHGETEQELEGTELAAQFAFSSLQKFGQEFLKKLKGRQMPNQLLEKATFAEIPGVLETGSVRKRDRQYPFNDACQWFIDHADLILLVYDYAKLDIGPETEALLDQLKGRETQVRIILNKADEITAEELLKIQGSLVWNVSPLMASMEPPKMYAGSFWSKPYKAGAPKKLLKAQEMSLLKDIQLAITKQVENRIATARRFAVRVRNHAKMVDCYLNTYNNHKGYLGDKNKVSEDIIENPNKYHIYEGLSTMTNISRYDLPDPEHYRDFFHLHPLYDFSTLKSTCTFFKGCPINKLDVAIAYEFPELITTYKKEANKLKGSSS